MILYRPKEGSEALYEKMADIFMPIALAIGKSIQLASQIEPNANAKEIDEMNRRVETAAANLVMTSRYMNNKAKSDKTVKPLKVIARAQCGVQYKMPSRRGRRA